MIWRTVTLAGLIISVAGCATGGGVGQYETGAIAAEDMASAATEEPARLMVANTDIVENIQGYRIARAYNVGGAPFIPSAGGPPAGVLLLRQNDQILNTAICEAFTTNLPSTADVRRVNPEAKIIPTYWFLTEIDAGIGSCDFLLQYYDYGRAQEIRSSYGLASIAGPALLMVQDDGRYVGVDMSAYTPTQAKAVVADWFGLMVAQEVATSSPPEGTTATELTIAKPSGSGSAAGSSRAGASVGESTNAEKPTLGDAVCSVAGAIKSLGGVIRLVGNVGSAIFCRDGAST